MAQQHSQTQKVQTTTLDINMVAERDTTTTAPRLSTPRATNPRNWRATIPMTGGQRPENRHDRYASRTAGDVHDGTGRPGEPRCDSETVARPQFPRTDDSLFQVVRDRCAFSNEQDDARRRVDCVGL